MGYPKISTLLKRGSKTYGELFGGVIAHGCGCAVGTIVLEATKGAAINENFMPDWVAKKLGLEPGKTDYRFWQKGNGSLAAKINNLHFRKTKSREFIANWLAKSGK